MIKRHDLPLHGLRLWVTRPAAQAADLSLALAEQGADVVAFPLLDIAPPLDPLPLQQALARLSDYDLAIFISPSAIEAVFAVMTEPWPNSLAAAVIGPGSAKRAAELGIQQLIYPASQFDSEGLLAMPQMQQLAGQRVVIFRGQGGRELLPHALTAAGAQVQLISAYQRLAPSWNASELLTQLAHGCDGLIVSSSEAAQHLFHLGGEQAQLKLQSVQYFAPHPRIISALQAKGALHTVLTDAGDLGITRSICQHFGQPHL
ncbi:uroporphyrinogen-III synthase [Chitinibacter bivalviorum]|uniref:Uroporphyrinogen-III synthase n=1 Tax=Chitinibacter bivalviorum TaxID=2739434 RepID=A0A7H9BLF2_9NEIS|nr:uroporphyrinogen-III synthase [Chitinibacter bivalviorum]QLG89232.1 uroporphyrinogen-III synthase [Chitinibacter bivalviorum]